MGIKFANNASSNITHALTADATSVSITPGTGELFPSIVEGTDYFYATLAGNNGLEIVKVTRRVLDTMTVERAQDGTSALIFNQGDLFELRIVAADFEDTFSHVETTLEDTVSNLEATLEDTVSNLEATVEDTVDTLTASVNNKLSSYLPLSGGTMTGNLSLNNAFCNKPDGAVSFGVGSTWNDAPSISLYGPNATSGNPNAFVVRSGQASYSLVGTENGLLQWGGKDILTSAGGTLTGGLTGTEYSQKLSNIDVTATPSEATYGNTIRFVDKNNKLFAMLQPVQWSNGGNALRVIVGKKDGSQGGSLTIEEHGNGTTRGLTFDGNAVLTSAGGTVGNLVFNTTANAVISRSVDNAITHILGGTSADSGYVSLYGKDHSSYPSECRFSAGSTTLRVLKTGIGYLNGSRILEGSGVHVASTALTSGASIKLPAGGTWKYFRMIISSAGFAYNVKAGSASGGSVLYNYNTNDAGATFYVLAFRTA